MKPWFFLSYARENFDKYLNKFYRDLNEEIRTLTSSDEGDEGFFDKTSIELGKPWPNDLTTALQNCRTFICLYSPRYFTSEFCGKEWQAFSDRQDTHSARLATNQSRPALMFPVLWLPETSLPRPLPAVVSTVQYQHHDFGEVYAHEGLRLLIALRKYHDHYREFLAKFALKLTESAKEHCVPPLPNPQRINEIESAFHRPVDKNINAVSESINAGPRYVQFIFVAGRRDELSTVRERVDSYGEKGGRDWSPYLPDVAEEVGIIVQRIAADEQFHYEHVNLNDDIIKRIEEAERQNNIVAIIVDTWTLCLPRYNTSMREFDGRKFLNCVVLVSWNNRDHETTTQLSSLTDGMKRTFLRNCIQRDPNCFVEINSHDELKSELSAALHKALQRIIQGAKVMKRADHGIVISKPLITGVRRLPA
jgi:FxsC-like protein